MKKGVFFLLGFISGTLITFVFFMVVGLANMQGESSNITISEKSTLFTTADKFQILQVLTDGALAKSEKVEYGENRFSDPIVYIKAEGQNTFYDDQIIEVPVGKKAVQIGTFKYETKMGEKTVPVIEFR